VPRARIDPPASTHRFQVRRLADSGGPVADVPAHHYPGFMTGKPVGMGGSEGRTEAIGYSVAVTLRGALKDLCQRRQDVIPDARA